MVSLMTENEVSRRLNISVASLRRWRLLRRGPAFLKVGSWSGTSRRILRLGSPRCRLVARQATRKCP